MQEHHDSFVRGDPLPVEDDAGEGAHHGMPCAQQRGRRCSGQAEAEEAEDDKGRQARANN